MKSTDEAFKAVSASLTLHTLFFVLVVSVLKNTMEVWKSRRLPDGSMPHRPSGCRCRFQVSDGEVPHRSIQQALTLMCSIRT
jgi:hypothetical protein